MKSHANRMKLHSVEGLQPGRTVKTCTHNAVGCGQEDSVK